jgi:hypothetical protein
MWAIAIVAAATVAGGAAIQGCAHKAKTPQQQAQADSLAYQKRIREVVKEPARADQVIALADEMQRQVDQVRAKLAQSRAELLKLNANYNATRADFDAFFKQQDADRQALMDKAVSVRVQIGKLLTESEWQALRKFGVEALEADLKELAS